MSDGRIAHRQVCNYWEKFSGLHIKEIECMAGSGTALSAGWEEVASPIDVSDARNRLLAALPPSELLRLRPHLDDVPLPPGRILCDVGEPMERVYFVETGVVAIVTAFENLATVGVATVGPEGAVDVATLLLGAATAPARFRVLASGSALIMEAPAFRRVLGQSPQLRMACEAHVRALFVQMLQAVSCTRLHPVEQRYASWLLVCADRTEKDIFEWSQTSLAEVLNVPQSSVMAMARALQRAGMIRCCHSTITVLDRQGLEAAACECYRIVRDRCRRLLARALD